MTGTAGRSWDDVRGLWVIAYEIDPARRAEYLDWFHGVRIPEKRERPGYSKAAHYRIAGPGPVTGNGYIALFGATDTRVFLDPSPGQLKLQQDYLTRDREGVHVARIMGLAAAGTLGVLDFGRRASTYSSGSGGRAPEGDELPLSVQCGGRASGATHAEEVRSGAPAWMKLITTSPL
jgi:hypothetical protein